MVIYNNIIPVKGYKLINLFGLLFARKGCNITETDIVHEKIHTAQMKELLYIGFYIWYILEYIYLLIKFRSKNKAYRLNRFEKEAYDNQNVPDYLTNRKHYNYL